MKLGKMKFESSRSWKIFYYFNNTLKTFQLRSILSNLNRNFLTSDFPTQNFPTSRLFSNSRFYMYPCQQNREKFTSTPLYFLNFRFLSFFIFSNYILQATVATVTVYHQNKTFELIISYIVHCLLELITRQKDKMTELLCMQAAVVALQGFQSFYSFSQPTTWSKVPLSTKKI